MYWNRKNFEPRPLNHQLAQRDSDCFAAVSFAARSA
jgi:hypothetical protein